MIRIIMKTEDHASSANFGGPVEVTYKTMDFDLPSVEEFLTSKLPNWQSRQFVGIELVPSSTNLASLK